MLMEAIRADDIDTAHLDDGSADRIAVSIAMAGETTEAEGPGASNLWHLRLSEARVARLVAKKVIGQFTSPLYEKVDRIKNFGAENLENLDVPDTEDLIEITEEFLRTKQVDAEIALLCTPAPNYSALATKIAFLASPEHGAEWGYESQMVRDAIRADALRFGGQSLDI